MVSTNASTENTPATSSPVSVPNSPTILTMNSNEQLININVVAQAPLKLDNTNYQSWRYQWETILTAYDFLHFIEQPPSSTTTPFHQRQDHLIQSAIVASLSSDIVPFVIDAKSSYALWQNLTATYAKPSRARIMSLRESLSNLKKGNLSITSYLQKIKQICSTLACTGIQISMDELFLHALHGLPAEYDTITAALRARETPVTFEELHEKLLDFEQNLIRSSSSTTVPITTNFAAKPLLHNNCSRPNHVSRPGNNLNPTDRPASNNFGAQLAGQNTNRNRPRVTCQLCDKPGHHVKQCRKLLMILSLINGSGSDGHTRNNAPSQSQQPRANYATHNTNNDGNWLVDSGASHHVTQDLHNLSLHSDYDGTEDIMLGDGKEHKITHTGSASLPSSSRPLTLSNVLCVPKMKKNLISVHQLCNDNSVSVTFSPYSFVVNDFCTGAPLLAGKPENGVYPWPSSLRSPTSPQALTTTTTASASNWHRRLGHPSSPTLRQFV
ncbi:hypothetical protein KY290_015201 [Solanum tuberosum]|uniref:Retrovirus-related Pol polyprotein from transposon TNT 1-94-like beta-barrel domain-containing protein n=1 Tax=Solanum tuberosum TaxID=4113 RepID=A0ABQ7VRX3_SOLTU|nr:hypothetical protein KY290_015201 [Solanum tuberosum]